MVHVLRDEQQIMAVTAFSPFSKALKPQLLTTCMNKLLYHSAEATQ